MPVAVLPSTCPTAPLKGYGLPTRIAPRWYTGYLTFQHGMARTRTESLVGSGVINPVSFVGTFQPVVVNYATRTNSTVGSGTLVSNEPTGLNLLPQPTRRGGSVGGVS